MKSVVGYSRRPLSPVTIHANLWKYHSVLISIEREVQWWSDALSSEMPAWNSKFEGLYSTSSAMNLQPKKEEKKEQKIKLDMTFIGNYSFIVASSFERRAVPSTVRTNTHKAWYHCPCRVKLSLLKHNHGIHTTSRLGWLSQDEQAVRPVEARARDVTTHMYVGGTYLVRSTYCLYGHAESSSGEEIC